MSETELTPIDVDDIKEDSGLSTKEKETIIQWAKDQDRVHIHTDMAGVMRRLLQHPEFELDDANEYNGDVTALRGTLPLGALSIRESPRKHGSHADVITSAVMRDD